MRWEDIKSRFVQQLNLTVLFLLILGSGLTKTYNLLLYLALFEIWYLLPSTDRPRQSTADSVEAHNPSLSLWEGVEWRRIKWQALWFVLLAYGILRLIVLRAGPLRILEHTVETRYERWEVAALVWNVVFAILSYMSVPLVNKLVPALRFVAGGMLSYLAFQALVDGYYNRHLFFVVMIGVIYLVIDFIVIRKLPTECERFMQVAFFVDLPTTLALGVLCLYSATTSTADYMDVYISGLISFQFIVSSLVLAFIDSDIVKALPEPRVGRQTPVAASAAAGRE